MRIQCRSSSEGDYLPMLYLFERIWRTVELVVAVPRPAEKVREAHELFPPL
jgi:hypothetical protein